MDYAHKNGIVHRDLKPANILLSGNADTPLDQCVPKITDFGIAKLLNEDSRFTRTGDILGTPNYMAPEQALGRTDLIGPAADVYSLGAILYELLTGRPPFQGENSADVLLRLTKEEPDNPTRFVRGLPRDLITICMKCLDKSPAKRYASASDLMEDIDRYLRNEPILAVPSSVLDRVVKWARRRPTQAAMLAMALGITILSFTLLSMMYLQAVDHSKELHDMLTRQETLLAEAYLDRGFHLAEEGDVRRGLHWMFRSLEIAEGVETKRDEKIPLTNTIRMNLAAWGENVSTTDKLLSHRDWAWDVAFTTDGEFAITASPDRTVRIWNAQTGKPAGPVLEHAHSVWAVAVHPDGKTIFTITGEKVCTTGSICVWTRENEKSAEFKLRGEPLAFPHELFRMQMNKKGDRLWVSSVHHGLSYLLAYDAANPGNGLSLVNMPLPGHHVFGTFSNDGQTLATIEATTLDDTKQPTDRLTTTTNVQLWDTRTGKALGEPLAHVGPVRSITFNTDGRFLVAGCSLSNARDRGESSALCVWDCLTRKLITQTPPLPGRIKTSVFAPNGQMFAVSSFYFVQNKGSGINVTTGDVQIWLMNSEGRIEPLESPMTAEHVVWSMAFSPDSRMLLAGCENSFAYLWSVTTGKKVQPNVWHEGNCVKVCFSPDGRRALTASAGGTFSAAARLWDVPRFSNLGSPIFQFGAIHTMLWDEDNKHVWIGSDSNQHCWNPVTAGLIDHFRFPKRCSQTHRMPANSKWVVELENGDMRLFDPRDRSMEKIPGLVKTPSNVFGYNAASQQLIAYQNHRVNFQVFGLDGKPQTGHFSDPTRQMIMFTVSGDGRILAVAVSDSDQMHYVLLYDLKDNFRILHQTMPQKNSIFAIDFSSDNKTLAFGGTDQQVQRLDLATKQLIGAPLLTKGTINWIGFARNNKLLLTRNDHNSVVLWDVTTGNRIGPALDNRTAIELLAIHPQGDSVLIGTRGKMAMNWRIPQPLTGKLGEIKRWIETITEMEMQPNDAVHRIDVAKGRMR